MSQVKKLQVGGKFIIDGQEISGDKAINAVRSYLGETTGGIMDALREGQTVDYNSANNTISITNSNGQSLTNNYLPAGQKASVTDSRFKKDWGATFHTKTDQFKRELSKLKGIIVNNNDSNNEPVIDLTQLRKGSGWFYTKDKNGNDIFEEGPLNKDRLAMLSEFRDYIQHYGDLGEEASKKKYKTDGWNADNLRALQNYFKDYKAPTDRDNYWTGLIGRIKGNKLENSDKELLRLMGFDDSSNNGNSGNGSNNGNGASGYAIDPNWKGSKDASKNAGIGWKKDDSGRWEIVAPDDSIYRTNNWWTEGLDFIPDDYQKGFLLNGKLYKENEVYGNPSLSPYVSGWYSNTNKNWNDWYDAANNSGIRFVNDRIWDNGGEDYYGVYSQQFNPEEQYNEFLTPYFNKANINGVVNVADVTDQYNNLPDGSKVFTYLDPSSAFNNRGVPTPTYIYYNPNNKDNPYSTNLNGLTRNMYGGNGNFQFTNWVSGKKRGDNEWNFGSKGRTKFALYKELGVPGQENSVLIDPNGTLYLGKWNPNGEKLIGNRINNLGLLEEILKDPTNKKWTNKHIEYLQYNPDYKKIEYKDGGKLAKLQFGGPVKNTHTTVTKKDTNKAKTDIIKPHKIDGSDGELTSWEKMQIGAAIGDALGVGMSFLGPVGGITGAATGVASTGTRFIADVKKDGLDWGDVKRGAINLGFDLAALPASLIPGADNAIKYAKLTKTVRSIGQPILKWLGTIGAAKGVKDIAEKWINGESPTSQDVSAFISGIGAGAVAGKQWSKQLGASKLAANRSAASAKIKNANIPENVEAPIGTGKTLKYKTSELSELISKNSGKQKPVIDQIISDAGKQGVTLTEKGAEEVLKTMGVNIGEKGKFNFWVRKNGKWVAPWKRGETTVSFSPQEPVESQNAWHYFFKPIARQRALGYIKPSKNQSNLLENLTAEEYNSFLNMSLRDHTIGGALRRIGLDNPDALKFGLNAPIYETIPWQFGRRGWVRRASTNNFPVLYRKPEVIQPEVVRESGGWRPILKLNANSTQNELPSGFIPRGLLGQRNSQTNPLYGPGIIKYQAPRKQKDTQFIVYQPGFMFKNGGKIVKAQNGTKTNRPQLIPIVDKSTLYDSLAHLENLDNLRAQESINKTLSNTGTSIRQNYINNNYKAPTLLTKTNGSDNRTGGLWGNEWLLNEPNIDDAIRAGITARAIYHDRDLQRQALGKLYQRQFQTPQFDRAKYDYSDIEQGYNESTKPYLESKFVTSDARDSMAFKLNKAQQLSGLAGQKNAQLTQRFNQIGDINRQIDAQNETNRIQTANEKSQYLTNLNYQDAMLNSVTWNRLFSDVINPFGQQMSQQGRDAWNKNLSGQYQFDAQNFQRQEAARIQGALLNNYKDKWNALSEDQRKQYGDIETYAYTVDPEGYKKIVNGNEIYRGQMWDLMRKYSRAAGAGFFYKSGGTINIKTTNKNLRPAQEQIAINSAKSAKRSVDELSKALLKMLAQLTK